MIPKRTKTVTLTFKREALLYDIKNYAFVEGDVMSTDNDRAQMHVFDIAEEGNVDRVTRILDLAHAECVEAMYPYTKEPCDNIENKDDILTETQEYLIHLLVPDDFSKTTINIITKLVHEYMVYRVLSDWMGITNPASKGTWDEKLIDTAEQIREHLNARCRRVRRTQTPF